MINILKALEQKKTQKENGESTIIGKMTKELPVVPLPVGAVKQPDIEKKEKKIYDIEGLIEEVVEHDKKERKKKKFKSNIVEKLKQYLTDNYEDEEDEK
jgi:hypothetical protein